VSAWLLPHRARVLSIFPQNGGLSRVDRTCCLSLMDRAGPRGYGLPVRVFLGFKLSSAAVLPLEVAACQR
jgi:hypothetical protein